MDLIEKIRKKSQKEKIRLIKIICVVLTGLMLIIWIFTSKIGKNLPKDMKLFQTIKKGINNLR